MSEQSTSGDPIAAFGPNEWLVDELYQRYLTDKHSVDQAWWEFFKDYGSDGGRAGMADTPRLSRSWADGKASMKNGDDRPLARSERFELPALGIEIRCSIQLSYERINVFNVLAGF